jgi:hypothetical protein
MHSLWSSVTALYLAMLLASRALSLPPCVIIIVIIFYKIFRKEEILALTGEQ